MFEHAFKQHPHNEELGVQTFFAYVRIGNWKSAQQVKYPSSMIGNASNLPKLVQFGTKCQANSVNFTREST